MTSTAGYTLNASNTSLEEAVGQMTTEGTTGKTQRGGRRSTGIKSAKAHEVKQGRSEVRSDMADDDETAASEHPAETRERGADGLDQGAEHPARVVRFPIVTVQFSTRWVTAEVGRWTDAVLGGGRWATTRGFHGLAKAGAWVARLARSRSEGQSARAAHQQDTEAHATKQEPRKYDAGIATTRTTSHNAAV
ncbi:hypothetical protein [Krasilnikovia cinnamomea]|nr:hypothetical protein [Krasilnikovia cinnamomea]